MKRLFTLFLAVIISLLIIVSGWAAEDYPPPRDGKGTIGNSRNDDAWDRMISEKFELSEKAAVSTPPSGHWNLEATSTGVFVTDDLGASAQIGTGTATALDDIGNPDANTSIDLTDYYITLDSGDTDHDLFNIQGTGAFADYSVLRVEQKTGDPTDGTVLEVVAADANVDPLVVSASGKANALVVGQNTGVVTIAGVAEGTDALTLTAGDISLTDGDLNLDGGDATFAEDVSITGDLIGGTGLINYTNFDVDAAGGTTVTSLDVGDGNISNVGNIALDAINADGTAMTMGATAGQDVSIGNSTGNTYLIGDDINLTPTDATDNALQIVSSGAAVILDVDLGADDTVTLGSGSEKIAINSSDWDIGTTGNMTNIGSISADGALSTTSTFDVDGSANISDTTATSDVTIGNSTGNITMTSDNADITLTDTTDNVFQLVSSGGPVLMDVDLGADDTITIGSGAEKFVLASSNIDISNAGAITGATGITTSGALASTGTIDVDGNVNLADTTATSDVTIGNSTGDVQVTSDNIDFLGTDATDNVFVVANATGPVSYIDLSLGADDTLTVGNVAGKTAINSSDWTVSTTGDLGGIGTVASNGLYTFTGAAAADDAFKVDVAASATGQYYKVDAGTWLGVLGEGAGLDFRSDSAATAEAGSVIYVKLQGSAADAAAIDGKVLYGEDEAGATAGSYLVNLDSANNGSIHLTSGEALIENAAPLKWEGSTADAYETELDVTDPTADRTVALPDYDGDVPVVVAVSATQVDCTGVGTDTDITGSSVSLPDGFFAAGKTMKWTIVGTSDGTGGQAMTLNLYIDNADIVQLSLDTGQSDDWKAEFWMHEYTDTAHQKAWGELVNNTSAGEKFDYATDTTDFNDGGATTVKLRGSTNHADDHIYVEYVKVEYWE